MSEQQRRNAVQILLTLDKKDYEEGMPVFEKYSTRGVIIRDGKIATQHGSAGDYKILGGGVEPGEKLEDALIREVGEESGLIVIPESIRPIGENIVEKYISANPVCGTNIQPPSVKNSTVVSMPIKFM